ncbi:MAG: hypothetical protein JRE64_23000 [Deltaproteobacteria bacterium]|nr:hypothetical protein [Deltaproteobacteria bacterium]
MKPKILLRLLGLIALIFQLLLGGGSLNSAIAAAGELDQQYEQAKQDAMGICPPINLLDEEGNIINPLKNLNANTPYSPKKTCGKCHNYDKITQGYHFQQGKGEKMSQAFQETYPWCTSPGQYGGRW